MILVIAEKPSVAQSIAKVLGATSRKDGYMEGGNYIVSWCFGHLVELADASSYDERYAKWRYDDLPIVPENWMFEVTKDKAQQFKVLSALMKDKRVTELVCATDAGREGELIFRLVYNKAGCTKPFKRLWISSLEDSAIREGFNHLRDGKEYDRLYEAALSRSKADWIVGINGTRLFTTLYHKKLVVGRVQTPTLAMLVERDGKISTFQKEKYFNVHVGKGDLTADLEKVKTEEEAKRIAAACEKKQAVVSSLKRETKTVNPPKLYDLTTLQREANRYYGFTAQQTLDLVQTLYEKKLLTYPRTDSQFITDDMEDTARQVISIVCRQLPLFSGVSVTPDIARVTDNSKVTDHHAILPTVQLEKQDVSALPQSEQKILNLVGMRLLCATGEKHTYAETQISLSCEGYEFKTKGKTVVQNGWKAIEELFKSSLKTKEKDDPMKSLPEVHEGDVLDGVSASVTEHFTTPPKQYTEDTLLSAMETAGNDQFDDDTEKKGLGTPATRAGIIEKLVKSGFAERKGKSLVPTKDGCNLVCVLPEQITSPAMTAEWENTLMEIERGNADADAFLSGIVRMTGDLVKALLNRRAYFVIVSNARRALLTEHWQRRWKRVRDLAKNIRLPSIDDLFSTEEERQDAKLEKIQILPLSELHPFEGHPFQVRDDEEMDKMVDSVKEYGVMTPAIVRPRRDGGYEIVAGHRRCHASQRAGVDTMPCIVRDMDDDTAIILMVDSNCQREHILPSEKAKAYQMKLEAVKRKAGRPSKNNSAQVGPNLWASERVALDAGESKSQVKRYIALNNLTPDLMQLVDNGRLKTTPAVELSYLTQAIHGVDQMLQMGLLLL